MNHYTYLLQSKTDDMMYIGVRSCKCLPEEDNYWGSSKHLPKDVSDICDKFILGTFNSRKEALQDEINRHNINDVAKNPNFWNKAKQTSTGYDTTGTTISKERKANISKLFKNLPRTKEHCEKIRQAMLGREITAQARKKISKANKGRPSPFKGISMNVGVPKSEEHKRKIGDAHRGKKLSDELRQKMSEVRKGKPAPYSPTRYENIECPHCNKVGMKANMKRYHFDNCKEIVNVSA